MVRSESGILHSFLLCVCLFAILFHALSIEAAQSDEKKDEKKKVEPYKVQKLTQGMGLYALGPVSPDRKSIIVIAQKPDQSPNLYVMDLADFSIRPPMTSFQWGVANPVWSPDGSAIALAAYTESANFPDLYHLELRTKRLRQLTSNSFSDKEPVFTPDGKRVLFTTDESPLPDAAFGILHVASVSASGGKTEYFTEDETSSIKPAISADGNSVLLVKIDEASGRHTLWQYGLDGKPQRDLTARRFARIQGYTVHTAGGFAVIWAQEEPEQQDGVYLLDLKNGTVTSLPDDDMPKGNPTVSPNGQLVAFMAPTDSGMHLFLFDRTSGQIQQITNKGRRAFSPVFISDNQILFGSNREQVNEIFLVNLSIPGTEEKKDKK